MMTGLMEHAPVLVVIVPMLLAPLAVLLRSPTTAWSLFTAGAAFSTWISVLLLAQVLQTGTASYDLGGWPPPFGIEYRIDALNALILLLVSGVATAIAPFARTSIAREINEPRIYLVYALLLLCLTGLLGIAATGDAFNVFVFLEISSLSTYALVAMGHSRRSLVAAFQYLVMGTLGGTFILIGVGLLYAITGTLNMADIAERVPALYDSRVLFAATAFIVIGFGLKIALFPLHFWLPGAYAEAPSVVSAFVGGTATKIAAYGLLRYTVGIIGAAYVWESLSPLDIVVWLSCAAMLYGSLVAVFQRKIKRLLAYSSVAQVGYIVLGIALGTAGGAAAGVAHMVAHGVIKAGLFVFIGAVIWQLGSDRISILAGLSKRQPLMFAALVIFGIGLIGVPTTAGFTSKWMLVTALVDAQAWVPLVVVLLSSLLAVVYVGRLLEMAAFREPDESHPDSVAPLPIGMTVSIAAFAAATLALGVYGAPLVDTATAGAVAVFGAGP